VSFLVYERDCHMLAVSRAQWQMFVPPQRRPCSTSGPYARQRYCLLTLPRFKVARLNEFRSEPDFSSIGAHCMARSRSPSGVMHACCAPSRSGESFNLSICRSVSQYYLTRSLRTFKPMYLLRTGSSDRDLGVRAWLLEDGPEASASLDRLTPRLERGYSGRY